MYYVYEIVNLLGTVEYVGQTKDPSYRLLQHKSKPNRNQTGHGKFYKRLDISMHVIASYPTRKEARKVEEELQIFWGLPTDRSKGGNKRKLPVNVGSKSGMAKLTEDKVREIRNLSSQGFNNNQIAKMFEVTSTNISLIVRYKAWTHVK
jgi:hypothetical protein